MQDSHTKTKPKENVSALFLLRQKELKTSNKNKLFLKLELVNNEGYRKFGILWHRVNYYNDTLTFGDCLDIKGHIFDPQQDHLIHIDRISNKKNKHTFRFSDKTSKNKADQTWLYEQINDIKNPYADILKQYFTTLVQYDFLIQPAGKLWAFNYTGGLLIRSKYLFSYINCASRPIVDTYLIKTAILLQSAAFIKGFIKQDLIEYSSEARLLSLPILALVTVNEIIESSKHSVNKKAHLKHLLLMMPGISDHNNIVNPSSAEALLFYDAQILLNNLIGIEGLQKSPKNKNRIWTNYNHLLKRFILLSDQKNEII